MSARCSFGSFDGMFRGTITAGDFHRLAILRAQQLQLVHKLRPYRILTSLLAVEFFFAEVRVIVPVHTQLLRGLQNLLSQRITLQLPKLISSSCSSLFNGVLFTQLSIEIARVDTCSEFICQCELDMALNK